jgi:hypothetical protein
MEGLARLVSESMARNGFEPRVKPPRLQWSRWFLCESSFSLALLPCQPGIFAVAEEVVAPGGTIVPGGGKRMLAVFQVSEADDLGLAMTRLFGPYSLIRRRLAGGRCFARYAVIEDNAHRHTTAAQLQAWLASAADAASGLAADFADAAMPLAEVDGAEVTVSTDKLEARRCRLEPGTLPSGF